MSVQTEAEKEAERLKKKYSWEPGDVIIRRPTEAELAQVEDNLKKAAEFRAKQKKK